MQGGNVSRGLIRYMQERIFAKGQGMRRFDGRRAEVRTCKVIRRTKPRCVVYRNVNMQVGKVCGAAIQLCQESTCQARNSVLTLAYLNENLPSSQPPRIPYYILQTQMPRLHAKRTGCGALLRCAQKFEHAKRERGRRYEVS